MDGIAIKILSTLVLNFSNFSTGLIFLLSIDLPHKLGLSSINE